MESDESTERITFEHRRGLTKWSITIDIDNGAICCQRQLWVLDRNQIGKGFEKREGVKEEESR